MIAITLFLIIFVLIPFHFRLDVGDIHAPDTTNTLIFRSIFSDLLRIVINPNPSMFQKITERLVLASAWADFS